MIGRRTPGGTWAASVSLVATVAALLLLAGCGGSSSSPGPASYRGTGNGGGGSPSGQGAGGSPGAGSLATTAPAPVAAYPSGDPCAALASTVPVGSAPPACGAAWRTMQTSAIPGQDLTRLFPLPSSVGVASGVDPVTAAQWAEAFIRTDEFQRWAEVHGNLIMDTALDPPGHGGGLIETAMANGAQIIEPPCSAPTHLVAVNLGEAEVAALHAQGWPSPSASALLVTFPPCSGTVIKFPTGTQTTNITKTPITRLVSGTVQSLAPFGPIWVIDGDAPCGLQGLATVCALATAK